MGFVARTMALAACAAIVPGVSGAWEIETSASHGCHERWAAGALDEVGRIGEPPPLEGGMRHLRSSLDWDASWVADDLFAISLVMGAHSNDVGTAGSIDLARLIPLHNDPLDQDAHCLRASWEDGEEGDAGAVASCRAYIEGQVGEALLATGPDGLPDPTATGPVKVFLAYGGATEVPLSTFYFHMGKAMHALEDSFAHTYRSGDRHGVVEVHNWMEEVTGDRDTWRDGPAHTSAGDDCLCDREWGKPTYDAVREADAALLLAASAAGTREDREAAIALVLDTWLAHVPGCTMDNEYCVSPDPVDLAGDPCGGCSVASDSHAGAGVPAPAWIMAVVLVAISIARGWRS